MLSNPMKIRNFLALVFINAVFFELRATVFKAMGIDPRTELTDQLDRPFQLCDGEPLPLF